MVKKKKGNPKPLLASFNSEDNNENGKHFYFKENELSHREQILQFLQLSNFCIVPRSGCTYPNSILHLPGVIGCVTKILSMLPQRGQHPSLKK